MRHIMQRHNIIIVCAIALLTTSARSQESALSLAATQPAKERITWREQLRFERYELANERIDQLTIDTRFVYGLRKDLALTLNVPTIFRDRARGNDDQEGFGDTTLTLKWRFWQHDPAPVDTNRLALLAGVEMPTGTDGLSNDGWNPIVGIIYTKVHDRHGLNAALSYKFNTQGDRAPISAGAGDADLVTLETSYLYRIAPQAYASDTKGAWYVTVESFAEYETNSDFSWRIAPGILYEARRFTLELSPIVPVVNDISHRAELQWGLVVGVRMLF